MTRLEKDGFTFIWKVENFSMLPHQLGESLKSPKFVVDTWKDTEWYLELFPRGYKDEDHISLYFCKAPSDVELKLTYALTLVATDTYLNKSIRGVKDPTKGGWGNDYISLKNFNAKRDLYAPHDILSIRFHLHFDRESSTESQVKDEQEPKSLISRRGCTFWSGIHIQQRSFTWSVKNIGTCTGRIDTYLSQVNKDSPNLKLSLLFIDSECIPIEIEQTGLKSLVNKTDRLFVKCKITVVSNNVQYDDSEESTHLFESDHGDVWKFPPFLKTKHLTSDKYLDANAALNLQFDFTFSYKDDVYHWNTNYTPVSFELINKPQVSEWCSNLQSMLTSGDISDVTLKVGDNTYKSYRVVLAAHSSVFRAMFENDMKEKSSGEVEIEDVEPKVVKKMLTFLHSGVLEEDLSTDDAADLYRAADKYNIEPLKQRCAASLVSSLCVDSVCDVLVLSDVHKDDSLWVIACNFVGSHTSETLVSTHWSDLMKDNPDLTSRVMFVILMKNNTLCT